MRQTVHIFLKDTRQFHYPILALLVWTSLFVVAGTQEHSLSNLQRGYVWSLVMTTTAPFIFPLAWWVLISEVVRAESLVGDRQFWLTRPYSRSNLLAAKALFCLAYILVPMLLAQSAIILFRGLPLTSALPGLLWNGVLLMLVFVVPAFAVSAITSSLVQFVVAMAGAALVVSFGSEMSRSWAGVWWIPATLMTIAIVAAALAALSIQFRSRHRVRARTVVLAGILCALVVPSILPWNKAFAFQTRMRPFSISRVSATLLPPPAVPEGFVRSNAPIWFGYGLSGIDASTPVACDAAQFTLEGPQGNSWTSEIVRNSASNASTARDGCFFAIQPPNSFKTAVGDNAVVVRATLRATFFASKDASVAVGAPAQFLPGVGRCRAINLPITPSERQAVAGSYVICENAFAGPSRTIFHIGSSDMSSISSSYAPLPLVPAIFPITSTDMALPRVDVVAVSRWEPIAHVEVEAEPATITNMGWFAPPVQAND